MNRWTGFLTYNIGNTYNLQNNHDSAKAYYQQAIISNIKNNNITFLGFSYLYMARLFVNSGHPDSAFYYAMLAKKQLAYSKQLDMEPAVYRIIQNYYVGRNTDSAYYYLNLASVAQDSLTNINKQLLISSQNLDEQMKEQQHEKEKIKTRNKTQIEALLGLVAVFLIIAMILYRNSKQKQKANKVLQDQKQKVEVAYEQLKATQSQLIQSEKMASLGELTAGIAHEIQNPLNFVNNFSEVNSEMIEELKNELATGNLQLANEIADDIKSNEEKINHHGKRAGDIVKSMLEHSRTSTGVKEPTDINKLADEYLRLAYHGLRAKDKTFNAEMKTDFDESIGKINIVGQDIGRVLLNLYNNAFYACADRSRNTVNEENSGNSILYQPTVWVSTKKEGDHVTITVRDNGGGIPEKIKEKIFQPFFTTKPTGSGTGLGLSLSYDIVKAHGGEIKIENKEGEGAGFIVQLPVA